MRYLLEQYGIDPDTDIRIVYAPFPQAAAQLVSGRIDAAPLPEPLATTLVQGRGLRRYVRMQDAWAEISEGDPFSPQVSLFAAAGAERLSGELLRSLLEQWRAASQYVTENPQPAAEAYAADLGQPVSIVSEALRNTIFYVPGSEENTERVIAYLLRVGPGEMVSPSFFYEP
jgi:NitT/TauT family transport system substrate-binding protein